MTAALAGLRELARSPFWPLLPLAFAAWASLILLDPVLMLPRICSVSAMLPADFGLHSAASLLASWLLMVVATMSLLLHRPIQHVWNRSLRGRRLRATVEFAAGYVGLWIAAAALLTLLSIVLRSVLTGPAILPFLAGIALALLWQGSPAKRRLLNASHALQPLPAFGLAAEWASLRFGVTNAAACVGSCWALMLLPLLAGPAHIAVMMVVALVMLCERHATPRDVRASPPFLAAGTSVALASLAWALW
jgi:predicted metal-binding membrane protein